MGVVSELSDGSPYMTAGVMKIFSPAPIGFLPIARGLETQIAAGGTPEQLAAWHAQLLNNRVDAAVTAAFARVPKQVPQSAAGLTAKRVSAGAKPLVMVDLPAPPNVPVTVFVEGPTAEWALPIPKAAQGAPAGHRNFSFDLDGLPPGVDPNKGPFNLTFTVIEGERAYEVTTRLD